MALQMALTVDDFTWWDPNGVGKKSKLRIPLEILDVKICASEKGI